MSYDINVKGWYLKVVRNFLQNMRLAVLIDAVLIKKSIIDVYEWTNRNLESILSISPHSS